MQPVTTRRINRAASDAQASVRLIRTYYGAAALLAKNAQQASAAVDALPKPVRSTSIYMALCVLALTIDAVVVKPYCVHRHKL